ncbi:BREX-2 system adenine-specific DNA-methyltransferase PglX [Actinomycetospora sp. NBRC 106378]|uniref:BREX-2 system adenine-specific DNA-methyltransferase PglX n=1 Tax=Actinomycetospora sp. NBRC 106378 TaxID=3032208 RepID=UPI0024A5346B|nr:BREX-2 system adenine-specific DNA-methyltransferase PglX [Actinomycetospora sp. NBRC 106378]GLZ51342.1 DNA methylase [Actinomycetospora sp. NBRC 106378]
MIDAKVLLADLQEQVTLLETDLHRQTDEVADHARALRAEYEEQRRVRRTAAEWPAWRDAQFTQVAVAWVLSTVFLRFTEDNGLIDGTLVGDAAEEAQAEYFRAHRDHNDAVWLEGRFEVLRSSEAGRLLFDRDHNPLYSVPISHDAARDLVAFWRRTHADGTLRHDFTDPDWDTRFLGDLYQDLSEAAQKQYALLQTPRFVESFILDRAMTPALEEFGVRGFRIVDPACGSGHFLLDAFARLVDAWRNQATLEPYALATTALASVHGVDVNPFAVAIARFRLSMAAWQVAGVRRLDETIGQDWRPVIACGDSLRSLARQGSFESIDEQVGVPTMFEDVYRYRDQHLLEEGTYHVVVGNPPYITPKDSIDNEEYRRLWSACRLKYQLTVPFAQLFFRLAKTVDYDGRAAGYTGQITSNAFMKREFGTKLIGEFFPTITLTDVIDTSGAYIPGHGTPTVILIGRRAYPRAGGTVRAVLGTRGEPKQPADPEMGLVWTAIVEQVDQPDSESDWVSVVDLPRDRLTSHPWSLSGGGSGELFERLEHGALSTLGSSILRIGVFGMTNADEVFLAPRISFERRGLQNNSFRTLLLGDELRDWRSLPTTSSVFPYSAPPECEATNTLEEHVAQWLWPSRTVLGNRATFGGSTYFCEGRPWFQWHQLTRDPKAAPATIILAFVATHNHFVLDRGGKVFNRSAPVIKLPEGADEDDHLELLGILNSSAACFWMRQVSHNKGRPGAEQAGADEPWEHRYEFTGTKLEQFPLPERLPREAGRRLDGLATELSSVSPESVASEYTPTRELLADAHDRYLHLRARMIAEQEELDWGVYDLYGLLSDAERVDVVVGKPEDVPGLDLGERAFEIVLAREVAAGRTETQWFARHGSTPITELPGHWPDWYRTIVEHRIELIERRRDIALIERPECKRRWASEPWDKQQARALETWLLDRLEDRALWFAMDDSGAEQPSPRTVATLADALRADEDFVSVAGLWAQETHGRTDVDLASVVGVLVDGEHVPFLAAFRYKPAGLAHRREWERTWDLQRQEDRVAAELGYDDPTHPEVRDRVRKVVGDVPVPPKYGSGDFLRTSYWHHRGKLDVPKERFISYPAASRDGDGSLLLGWAGWDHREQAQALAVLITIRRGDDGWSDERMLPLLAGFAELMPWVKQWHGEIDPAYGSSPAEVYQGFLDAQLVEYGVTTAGLAAWRPEGRVDVSPLPRKQATSGTGRAQTSRAPKTIDPALIDAVLTAAVSGPLSNEDIRNVTGLDAAGARAVATSLVKDARLSTIGQKRGTRYQLP